MHQAWGIDKSGQNQFLIFSTHFLSYCIYICLCLFAFTLFFKLFICNSFPGKKLGLGLVSVLDQSLCWRVDPEVYSGMLSFFCDDERLRLMWGLMTWIMAVLIKSTVTMWSGQGHFPVQRVLGKRKQVFVSIIFMHPQNPDLDKSLVHNLIGPLKFKDKETEAKRRRNAPAPLPQCSPITTRHIIDRAQPKGKQS